VSVLFLGGVVGIFRGNLGMNSVRQLLIEGAVFI
jgi:hypothetical protein